MSAPVVISGTVDLGKVFKTDLSNSRHVPIGQLIYNELNNQMAKVGIPVQGMRYLLVGDKQEDWIPKVVSGKLWWNYNQRDETFQFEWTP